MAEENFDQWCNVDLFGHQVIAGKVTEQTIGGASFVRVDVPEVDGMPEFTRFYGDKAIYSMTPVSEEIARMAVKRYAPKPVTIYMPELQLQASVSEASESERRHPFEG